MPRSKTAIPRAVATAQSPRKSKSELNPKRSPAAAAVAAPSRRPRAEIKAPEPARATRAKTQRLVETLSAAAPAAPETAMPGAAVPTSASAAQPATGKQAQVVALLNRPEGASIAELMAATGWLPHSVRGLISAVVKRKLGLTVVSAPEPERGRVYRVEAAADPAPPPAPVAMPDAASVTTPTTEPALAMRRARKVRRAGPGTAGKASRGA